MGNTWWCGEIPEATRGVVGYTVLVLVQVMLRPMGNSRCCGAIPEATRGVVGFTLTLLCAHGGEAHGQHVVLRGDP